MNRFTHTTTTLEQAGKSMAGTKCSQQAMLIKQREIQQDKLIVAHLCKNFIDDMLRVAARLCGMSYHCAATNLEMDCYKTADMRKSWVQDGGSTNSKRVAWMFHYYPTHCHSMIYNNTHQGITENAVMKDMKVQYEDLHNMTAKHATCIQQAYTRELNNRKCNMIKNDYGNKHNVDVRIKKPNGWNDYNNRANYKRKKQEFYVISQTENGGRTVTLVRNKSEVLGT